MYEMYSFPIRCSLPLSSYHGFHLKYINRTTKSKFWTKNQCFDAHGIIFPLKWFEYAFKCGDPCNKYQNNNIQMQSAVQFKLKTNVKSVLPIDNVAELMWTRWNKTKKSMRKFKENIYLTMKLKIELYILNRW